MNSFLEVEDNIEIPPHLFTREIKIYLEKYARLRLGDETVAKDDEITEKIKLLINVSPREKAVRVKGSEISKNDHRFSREVNRAMQEELYRRIHERKYKIYKSMEKQLLSEYLRSASHGRDLGFRTEREGRV